MIFAKQPDDQGRVGVDVWESYSRGKNSVLRVPNLLEMVL